MKCRDFIARVQVIGRARGVPVRIDTKRGKGSHIIVITALARRSLRTDVRNSDQACCPPCFANWD